MRQQLASLGAGVAQTRGGAVRPNAPGTIVFHTDSTPVPVYSVEGAASPNTSGNFSTDDLGRVPGWVDQAYFGEQADITVPPAATVTVILGSNILTVPGLSAFGSVTPGTFGRSSTIAAPGLRDIYSFNDVGAVNDMVTLTDVSLSSASAHPTTSQHTWTSGDVGKIITIVGAGTSGDNLRTSVTAVVSGVPTLNNTASTSVSGAYATLGTPNGSAFSTATTAGVTYGAIRIWGQPGNYMTETAIQPGSNTMQVDLRGMIIDCSQAATIGGKRYGIYVTGWVGTSSSDTTPQTYLAADCGDGQMQAQVSTVTGLAKGQEILLACDAPRGTLHTTILSTDHTVIMDLGATSATPSPSGILRIESELMAYTSFTTSGSQLTFTIRSSPEGRGLWSGQFGNAAGHTAGVNMIENNGAKAMLKTTVSQDKGEWHRIALIDATNKIVYFDEPVNDHYAVANNASIRVGNLVTDLSIEGGTIQSAPDGGGTPTLEYLIYVAYTMRFKIVGTSIQNANNYGIRCIAAIQGTIDDCITDCGPMPADRLTINYGIAVESSCQWMSLSGNTSNRGMCVSFAQTSAGGGFWGIPRFCVVDACVAENSYTKEYANHAAFQVEGNGRMIHFGNCTADGCSSGYYLQGSQISVAGGSIRGWSRAAIFAPDTMFQVADVMVSNVQILKRTWGAGLTHLTADLASGTGNGGTITVAQTQNFFAGGTDNQSRTGALAFVKNTSGVLAIQEIISFNANTTTTFTIQARALCGTTATSFTAADSTIQIMSFSIFTYDPVPIALEFQSCIWGMGNGQISMNLGAAIATTDTTITLSATAPTNLPKSGYLQVEPQNLTGLVGTPTNQGLAPDVIYYNGVSGSTLSNIVMGCMGTIVPGVTSGVTLFSGTGHAHDTGLIISTYVPGVANFVVNNITVEMDFDYYSVYTQGYPATEGVVVQNCTIRNSTLTTSFQGSNSVVMAAFGSQAVRSESPNVTYSNNKIIGFQNGYVVYGGKTKIKRNDVENGFQQTAGIAFDIFGSNVRVDGNETVLAFEGVNVRSSATGLVIVNNILDVGGVKANAITNQLADTYINNNTIPGVSGYVPWTPGDVGFLGWNFDPAYAQTKVVMATGGTVYQCKLKTDGGSVTNVVITVGTVGSGLTSGQCFAGLYQNGTLLGTTADQSAAWVSTGMKEMAISGGPVTVKPGIVYVAFFFNGTTGPALNGGDVHNTINHASNSFARWVTDSTNTGRTTTLPGTQGTLTAFETASHWAGVS